jgi:hypothetical protein
MKNRANKANGERGFVHIYQFAISTNQTRENRRSYINWRLGIRNTARRIALAPTTQKPNGDMTRHSTASTVFNSKPLFGRQARG